MRLSARAFVVDEARRLLLLDCIDPARPVGPLVGAARRGCRARRGRGHGERRHTRCHGRVVRVSPGSAASLALTDDEQGRILGQRWFTPAELAASTVRCFPRSGLR